MLGTRTLYLPKVQKVNIVSTQTASPKINPYTVYVADVKLAGLNNHTIIRRYSEFMELHDKLQTKYSSIKLYFPPKKAFGKLRADVINQRKDQLQVFLQTLIDHPVLSADYVVYTFLAPHLFPTKENVPVAVSLITLPNEIFLKCLLMISFKDVLALTEVCSHLFQYITTHPTLWLYLNARFDFSLLGNNKSNGGSLPNLTNRASIRSSKFFHSSSAIVIPQLSNFTSPSSSPSTPPMLSTSIPPPINTQFEVFSLNNPNVSSLSLSSDHITAPHSKPYDSDEEVQYNGQPLPPSAPANSTSPPKLKKSESMTSKKLRGSMMLRPHAVPAFHRNPQLVPTECVYMGADESEFRKIFLQNIRDYHKLRINVARENSTCNCALRKLVGTIVGDTGVGKTKLLQSCLTSFTPSLTPLWSAPIDITNYNNNINSNNNTPTFSTPTETNFIDHLNNHHRETTPLQSPDKSPPITPVDSHAKCYTTHIVSNSKFLCFQLFDSSGHHNDIVRHQHLSQSNFVIVTFSVVDRATFLHLKDRWIPEIREFSPEVPIVVVGLKRDLREDSSPANPNHVQFQEAMETIYKMGCVHYMESPSPSSGVGGWRTDFNSWRVNLLSEVGSLILFNVNPHTKPAKSAYEEKLAFLHKLFPFKQIESIGVALASCIGDIDQAVEFLVNQGPASPARGSTPLTSSGGIPLNRSTGALNKSTDSVQNTNGESKGEVIEGTSTPPNMSTPPSGADDWRLELRQSWKVEISRMEGSMRRDFINESVEAGLVVQNSWEDVEGPSPNPSPQKKVLDASATTALKAQRTAYLEKLKKTSVDRFIKDFLKRKIQPKQQAEMTVSFLGELSSYVSSHTLWEDAEEKEITSMREDLEGYVFSKIYKSVFAVNPADIAKDQFFHERIAKLVFITPSHLDIGEKFWNTDLWDAAADEINLMDQKKTPSDKLNCILNCCKAIIFLLTSGDSQAGADDFLPHLIYVLIKANPRSLASNIEFINSFCGPDVMRMEKYYYFTTLSVGVSFIENIEPSSLNIDPVTFEKLMNEPQ